VRLDPGGRVEVHEGGHLEPFLPERRRRLEEQVQLRLAALGGVVELFGSMLYARGAEVGLVSIVTAASATYPFIPVLGGVVLLHERLVPNQYVGVALVVAGLMLLALG